MRDRHRSTTAAAGAAETEKVASGVYLRASDAMTYGDVAMIVKASARHVQRRARP
jgi:hypothetical protein